MELTALLLYVGGLTVCFGVQSWLHRARTGGDAGFRRPLREPRSPAWWGAVSFVAALVLGLAGLLLGTLGLVGPLLPLDRVPAVPWLGFLLALAGFVGTVGAQQAMGRSWRIGVEATERTELVESGVFGWSRNPVFLTMIASLAGLTLVVPNVLQLAALVCLVLAVEVQVRGVEEPYLLQTHGADYAEYTSRVGRFIPGVGRLPRSGIAASS
ncbi:methyltransferase family protein [Actinomycetospora lemnae]|uniref:Isoprenylcysteine carboxylmethyltransferase family protein n=1 Tax=Actinomycetospora lemnae TaxID=3019891 RepID=A0ABT5T1F2_9PSEU|nr:isoprenylcysteine carboxylmethyltransferase family protein [Actinomycetospora sp. DW7H6]MDD7967773.1 isoprenylcysteine carboxylmethyltransferase family protein [Actinomycetospora sp. DW7H6]